MTTEKIMTEWLEFKALLGSNNYKWYYVNIRRDEISEVCNDCIEDTKFCTIIMKNGNRYVVMMPYNEVMELV